MRSASPELVRFQTLNPIEPPWYVTRMPGGVTGTAREGLPMSINTEYSGCYRWEEVDESIAQDSATCKAHRAGPRNIN